MKGVNWQWLLLGWFSCALFSAGQVDKNLNGISDWWEHLMEPVPLPLSMDTDNDGHSNLDEAVAGTDPRDPGSRLHLQHHFLGGGPETNLRLSFHTFPGKQYVLEYNTPDNLLYRPLVAPYLGSGNRLTIWVAHTPATVGSATAECWLQMPADVSEPGDLATTAMAPDLKLGLKQLSLADVNFDLAAVRVRGHYLHSKTTGLYRFGLSGTGRAEWSFNPASADAGGLVPQVAHDGSGSTQSAAVQLALRQSRPFQLTYLPSDPAKAMVDVTIQDAGVNPAPAFALAGNNLLPWLGEAAEIQEVLDKPGATFRVAASDLDSDADGVTDWEELALGLNPMDPTTFDTPDMAVAPGIIANGGPVRVRLVSPPNPLTLIEELQSTSTFQIERLSGTAAVSIPIRLSGVDSSDLNLPAEVVLPDGQSSVQFSVAAVADNRLEPAEVATISLERAPGVLPGPQTAIIILEDEVDPQPLFFSAAYVRENGPTEAWGHATITLAPDRRTAFVSSRFYNLTSPQNNAHIHRVSNKTIVEGLPDDTFVDHVWQLGEPFNMEMPGMVLQDASLQEKLDLLVSAGLYANVHTEQNPSGEIYGVFLPADAAFEFVEPAPLAPDPGAPRTTDLDAFRFLEQATFGPTDADMASASFIGINLWLDRQMEAGRAPRQSFEGYCRAVDAHDVDGRPIDQSRNLRSAWYNGAIFGRDALRQRVTFALSQIFTASTDNNFIALRSYGMASYQDMLAQHAFGNYRELLEAVARHPIMGIYLSHLKNEKENVDAGTKPDENFAREIMQLFSIGLFERHPDGTFRLDQNGQLIPTYDNEHITALARVFTGLSYSWHHNTPDNVNTAFNYYGGPLTDQTAYTKPMIMFQEAHDEAEKALVGGVLIPARVDAEQDLEDALDTLHNHPNTPSFIATLLIKQLVTSNPSRGYVYRVAESFRDNGSGVRGDMKAVLKAVFLDQEARNPDFYESDRYGKLREPLMVFTTALRAFPPTNDLPLSDVRGINLTAYNNGTPIRMPILARSSEPLFGQTPMHAPSVFGWFRPEYSPGGILGAAQLTGPEFALRTDSLIVSNIDSMTELFWLPQFNIGTVVNQGGFADDLKFDVSTASLEALTVPELVEELDRRLRGGRMSPALKSAMLRNLPLIPTARDRARSAIVLVLNAPEFVAQR